MYSQFYISWIICYDTYCFENQEVYQNELKYWKDIKLQVKLDERIKRPILRLNLILYLCEVN